VHMLAKAKKDVLELEGVVLEALPNANFRVQLDDTEQASRRCSRTHATTMRSIDAAHEMDENSREEASSPLGAIRSTIRSKMYRRIWRNRPQFTFALVCGASVCVCRCRGCRERHS